MPEKTKENRAELDGQLRKDQHHGKVFLVGATLDEANFQDADLRDADLRHATLRKTNLREADLRRADLTQADYSGARFEEALVSDAKPEAFRRFAAGKGAEDDNDP